MIVRRLLTALLVALLLSATFTFVLARKLAQPHTTTLRYVAAARDLDAGDVVKLEDLRMVTWPSNASITGALLSPGDAVGRAVLNPVVTGQPIVTRELSAVGGVGLSAKIPKGMRAISLKSDQVVGVAGFLLPGTHTDVLVTYRNPSQTDAVTSTVLQDAEVLAAGQKTQADPEGKPSTVDVVTLLVTPHEAERVVLASTQGTVHFVLRNGADQQQTEPGVMDVAALGLAPKPVARSGSGTVNSLPEKPVAEKRRSAARAKVQTSPEYQVIVVRGDKRTQETFQ